MVAGYVQGVLNASPFSLIITVVAVLLAFIYYVTRDRGLPPGPTGLPIFGIYPFMNNQNLHLQLDKYVQKYGDVSSFRVAGTLFINLGSLKAMREAHVTNSDHFSGRSTDFNPMTILFHEGILFSNGEVWKTLRKFFLSAFKDIGLKSMQDNVTGPVYDTIDSTMKDLRSLNGEPVDIVEMVNTKLMDTARCTFFGEDGITVEQFRKFIEGYIAAVEGLLTPNVFLFGNIAKYFIIPFKSACQGYIAGKNQVEAILLEVIDQHENTLEENHNRNIIDAYLKERNERRRKGDPTAEYFTKKALAASVAQFAGDGHQAIVVFVGRLFLALVQHPEVQEKIYEELLEVVGPDRNPGLEDKSNLPYANAFMNELSRTTELFPFFPSLLCTKEVNLRGYRIPKGSITVTNFYSAHHDPEIFEDPFKFDPSRYLTSSGKPRAELPLTFGIGKRSCIGETYSVTLVFLYMINIVKNFRLSFPKEDDYSASGYEMKLKIIATPR
ncbi:cytochrome P450 2B11-like [Stegodyphus dumicola]|uniref:cytochrome P450 2B11-like n=1 Tax=Stegodyphus dumicola TaxID=202533 RepID=UPI0015B19F53|nr:cytochrome P450 2B11-like [Stegodyphus dumicola]XP_035210437.1 cytochrome P450 2B11-like [Stegodyphus dumicola]